jgi:VanZ family protein
VATRLVRIVWGTLPIAAAIGWAWFLFWISSDPTPLGADLTDDGNFLDFLPRADLFAHFGVYAILAFFLRWSLAWVRTWRPFEQAIRNGMPVVIVGVYGASLELMQETIDARAGEILDAVADSAGAIAMVFFLAYLWPRSVRLTRRLVARLD